MSHDVQLIACSVAPHGRRLATFLLSYPMIIHWDVLTHRALSRNAESGRAISVPRKIRKVNDAPFRPSPWMADATRMRDGEPLPDQVQRQCDVTWDMARESAILCAERLHALGAHRQQVNSLLIPFGNHVVVLSGTEWDNFFALRVPKGARSEFRAMARDMALAYRDTEPTPVDWGEWHLPFVTPGEVAAWGWQDAVKVSVARCSRTTFLRHDGTSAVLEDEIRSHDQRLADCHFSPFEHQATPAQNARVRSGNFVGWRQYRQCLPKSVLTDFDFSTLDRRGDS